MAICTVCSPKAAPTKEKIIKELVFPALIKFIRNIDVEHACGFSCGKGDPSASIVNLYHH